MGMSRHETRKNLDEALLHLKSCLAHGQDLAEVIGRHFYQDEHHQKLLEHVEILKGVENIHDHICRLIHNAKNEILAFVRPPYACGDHKKVGEQLREYGDFMTRGGILQWVFEVDCPGQAELVPVVVEAIKNEKAQIRIAERLPTNLMIFDRMEVLVLQEDAINLPDELTMMWLNNDTLAGAFRSLFLFVFEKSSDYTTWKKESKESKRVLSKLDREKEGFNREDGKHSMETGF